jgi:hypothetical protein
MTQSRTRSRIHWMLWAAALAMLVATTSARAEDDQKPWTLDQNNWQLGKDLLPEVVLNRVKNGDYSYKDRKSVV